MTTTLLLLAFALLVAFAALPPGSTTVTGPTVVGTASCCCPSGIVTTCCPGTGTFAGLPSVLFATLTWRSGNVACNCASGTVIPLVYDPATGVWSGIGNLGTCVFQGYTAPAKLAVCLQCHCSVATDSTKFCLSIDFYPSTVNVGTGLGTGTLVETVCQGRFSSALTTFQIVHTGTAPPAANQYFCDPFHLYFSFGLDPRYCGGLAGDPIGNYDMDITT